MEISPKETERLIDDRQWDLLFDELCRAHRLKWRQKWLLKSISQTLEVEPAARLFIEPDWFASAAKTQGLQRRSGQLAELCKTLFYREKSELEKMVNQPKESTHSEQLAGI